MNRKLLKKIDFVIHELNQERSDDTKVAPSTEIQRELIKLLHRVEVVDDLVGADHWASFSKDREGLTKKVGIGPSIDAWKRLDGIAEAVTRALNAPLRLTESRFDWIEKDGVLREILERDLEEAESSFKVGNWKSCMVMCGSILEAALYELLGRDPAWTMRQEGVAKYDDGTPKQIKSKKREEQWTLEQLVNFACKHRLVEEQLRGVLHDGIREPRNLVHAVAELRKGHQVDRVSARLCLAALKKALDRIAQAQVPPKQAPPP